MKKIRYVLVVILVIVCLFHPADVSATEVIEPMSIEEIEELQNTTLKPILYRINFIKNYDFETLKKHNNQKEEIEQLEYFSDTIKVKVTKEQKEKIENEILKFQPEIEMLAKLVYREARGIKSVPHKAAVIWCVLNRVDNGNYGNSIREVITAKHQFAWVPKTPVKEEFYNLAEDVIIRWFLEKEGLDNVGRVLPNDYLFFAGRNGENYFRKSYRSREYWDWTLENPYITMAQEDN
jgi:hypothetical protein